MLRGRALEWWQQLKLTQNRLGKSRIVTWAKMKKCLRTNVWPNNFQWLMYQRLQNLKQGFRLVDEYITDFCHLVARNVIQETDDQLVAWYIGGLRFQIMDSVNLFDPLIVFETHQRALAFVKQNRQVGGSYSPAPAGGSSGSGGGGPRVVPSHRQVDFKQDGKRHLCVESDDEQYEDYEKGPEYDEEPKYEEDVVTGDVGAFQKLALKTESQPKHYKLPLNTESHPKLYKLQWLKKCGNDKDDILCDVVPMDACHLLLGRPWEYEQSIEHNGRSNSYSFLYGRVKITLVPSKPKQKPVPEEVEIPEAMIHLLEEFSDVFLDELPDGLPPIRDIQHHIDMEPGSQFPNRPHYRMSPREHEELHRQVEELISKGHVRECMSPCDVPTLLTPKKYVTWRMCVDSRAINKINCEVDESKVAAVQNWPTPTTITEAHHFHRLASVYRRFIPHFSSIMAPITDSMKRHLFGQKGQSYLFKLLRINSLPRQLWYCLTFRKFLNFILMPQRLGLGGYQSRGQPIAYFSEKLTGEKLRYSTYDLEFYAVVKALATYPYFSGVLKDVQASKKLEILLLDGFLFKAEFAHNHVVNRSTGFSPFKVVYSAKPRDPLVLMSLHGPGSIPKKVLDFVMGLHEVHAVVQENLANANSKYKQVVDQKRRQVDFEVGDFVWAVLTKDRFQIGEYNNLSAKKIGPVEIVQKINSNAYPMKLRSHILCSDVIQCQTFSAVSWGFV
ncbi:uncharacterized protein LOC143582552 [Bidens hawaiensis]|uniref:uncharacterized protein LOC143582552 n=1 Tax=Bidens hawaiensis TaxID=980011 RepID=UPI004048F9B8